MGKPALHEILAVEKTLETTANRLMVESARTFSKQNLFQGTTRKLTMFDPAQSHLENTEHQELTTTVDENLDYLVKPLSKYWAAVLQKDMTNQLAKADLVLDNGTILATAVPASFLLSFEKRLREMREVYNQIPTLAPGRKWVEAQLERPGVYIDSDDAVQFKAHKEREFIVVAEATKEHPAQIREVDRTVNVGKYTTTELSGMLSPLEKAERLTRIDELINAVKRARMRANKQELVDKVDIGAAVFKYING